MSIGITSTEPEDGSNAREEPADQYRLTYAITKRSKLETTKTTAHCHLPALSSTHPNHKKRRNMMKRRKNPIVVKI